MGEQADRRHRREEGDRERGPGVRERSKEAVGRGREQGELRG